MKSFLRSLTSLYAWAGVGFLWLSIAVLSLSYNDGTTSVVAFPIWLIGCALLYRAFTRPPSPSKDDRKVSLLSFMTALIVKSPDEQNSDRL